MGHTTLGLEGIMIMRHTPYHQVMRSIVLCCISLILLTGCASHTALTKPVRESIRSVSVSKDVKLPKDLSLPGVDASLLSAALEKVSDEGPKAQLKKAMQKDQIDVAQIVHEQFTTKLIESRIFPSVVSDSGDAQITLEVRMLGFGWGFSHLMRPLLLVIGSLVRPDGTLLWQQQTYVSPLNSHLPGHEFAEYVKNPKFIREAYTVAAQIMSDEFVKSMRQD